MTSAEGSPPEGEVALTPGPSNGRPGPFEGLRVVEIGDESSEYCGLLLAGLGATVIKVEPPEGSPSRMIGPFFEDVVDRERSLHFWVYNRGKRSVVIDPTDPEAQQQFRSLLGTADVLVDSTRRGTPETFQFESDDLTCAFPTLVHARMTPFGDDGPWADYEASDLVSLALGGVAMNCGYDSDPFGHYDLAPIAPQACHSFHIAGEQLAIGIVSALLSRHLTGRGQNVSCAIHQAVATNTESDLMSWVMIRQPLHRQTCRHALAEPSEPSISYTKDGRWLLGMILGQRDRDRLGPFLSKYGIATPFAETAEEPDVGVLAVAGSTASSTDSTEYIQRMARQYRYRDLPWEQAQEAGLLWSPVRKPEENAGDNHWLSRGTFADVEHPVVGATFRYPVSKWISTEGTWQSGPCAPALGQDNDEIVGQLAETVAPKVVVREASTTERCSELGKPFALQGIRILDFTWFLASAGATRILAALGADVLKIEWRTHPDSGRGALVPRGGRAAREAARAPLESLSDTSIGGQFNNKNPGKRSLSLNVAHPKGLEIAKALIAQCDVVAEGFSPGVLERWGLGYEVQQSIRPDIIYAKQSGMGSFGTYERFRAVGPIAAALSGVSEMSGFPSPAPPAGWGYSYLDWFGAYSMALSILTALYHRDRTGKGQWIDASQTEVGIALTSVANLDWAANGRSWERVGNRSPYKVAGPEGIYACAGEDRWIAITCATDAHWQSLVGLAGREEWLDDPRFGTVALRYANHESLDAAIEGWTVEHDRYDLMEQLQERGVPAGVCQTAEDRCDRDPQLASLQWLTELTGTKIGTWPLAELPVKMSETPPYLGGLGNRAAPLYGEDNMDILTGLLNMSEAQVIELTNEGVL